VLYWSPLSALFHTVALPAETLGLMLVLASAALWVEEVRKFIARRRPPATHRAHA
jgi:hypothetical protein